MTGSAAVTFSRFMRANLIDQFAAAELRDRARCATGLDLTRDAHAEVAELGRRLERGAAEVERRSRDRGRRIVATPEYNHLALGGLEVVPVAAAILVRRVEQRLQLPP